MTSIHLIPEMNSGSKHLCYQWISDEFKNYLRCSISHLQIRTSWILHWPPEVHFINVKELLNAILLTFYFLFYIILSEIKKICAPSAPQIHHSITAWWVTFRKNDEACSTNPAVIEDRVPQSIALALLKGGHIKEELLYINSK